MEGTPTFPRFFDIHSHVNDARFDQDRIEVIEHTLRGGVFTISVGTDRRSSELVTQLAEFYDGMYSSIGIHPTDNTKEQFNEKYFTELAGSRKVVAVGECGLDYLRAADASESEKKRQKDLFETQIEFAVRIGKPLMVHCREAHRDAIDILASKKREHGDKLWGNIHFFSAGPDIAKQYLELGFSMSFSGVITFARDYDDTVRYVPLSMIMSETDSPYAAPVPFRGKRNESLYVEEVVKKIAEIRGEPLETVAHALVANAFKIFRITAPPTKNQ
ncbi:MAG: TatD family hydrolase [Candidatus Yonathbacteria bacterium]|nr:TatD family hydrolase [Candidatus Yonathbacteria bacterium]